MIDSKLFHLMCLLGDNDGARVGLSVLFQSDVSLSDEYLLRGIFITHGPRVGLMVGYLRKFVRVKSEDTRKQRRLCSGEHTMVGFKFGLYRWPKSWNEEWKREKVGEWMREKVGKSKTRLCAQ